MGTRDGMQVGVLLGHRDLVPDPAGRDADPRQGAHLRQLGPAGEHDEGRVDLAVAGRAPRAPGRRSRDGRPRKATRSATVTPLPQQGHGVGGHVARRADVPVVGAERAAQCLPRGQRRVDRVHLVRIQPYRADPERRLHGQPLPGGLDLGRGEARQQVALADEARVGAELRVLPEVEPAGPDAQAHRLRGAALQPDHARGAAARALAEDALLDQHDALQARRAAGSRRTTRRPSRRRPRPRPRCPEGQVRALARATMLA